MAAYYFFREYWFRRWGGNCSATFLPGLRPMHRVWFPKKGMSFYTPSVTHTMFSEWTTSFGMIAGRKDGV